MVYAAVGALLLNVPRPCRGDGLARLGPSAEPGPPGHCKGLGRQDAGHTGSPPGPARHLAGACVGRILPAHPRPADLQVLPRLPPRQRAAGLSRLAAATGAGDHPGFHQGPDRGRLDPRRRNHLRRPDRLRLPRGHRHSDLLIPRGRARPPVVQGDRDAADAGRCPTLLPLRGP